MSGAAGPAAAPPFGSAGGVLSSTVSSPASSGKIQLAPAGPATLTSTKNTSPTPTSLFEGVAVALGVSAAPTETATRGSATASHHRLNVASPAP